MQRFYRTLCAAAMLTAMAVGTAQADCTAIVTSGSMAVYADVGCAWQTGTLPATTIVQAADAGSGMAQITYRGCTGYAKTSDMASLSSLAKAVTFNTSSRVYQKPTLSAKWIAIPQGMQVNLLATYNGWAMVEKDGIVAYTRADHLTEGEAQTESKVEETIENQPVYEDFAAVTAAQTAVYASAGTSKKLGTLPKDVTVTVHAYTAEWAYIELNGCYGFAEVKNLTRTAEKQEENYLYDENLSTEQIIYLFLTREMKLNTAAACGILANVERECDFRITAASSDGGYGIVQWTGVRNKRVKNWCTENGYDYAKLDGQLWFLKYELEHYYPKVLKVLQSCENSATGAYDMGYYFCYNFEIPARRLASSIQRGNIARDTYWKKYA